MSLRKILLLLGVFILLVFGPMFLLSSGMMRWYQSKIDANPNSESAKKWQLRLAGICETLHVEIAADMYGKFAEHYPEDELRPQVLWWQSDCFDRSGMRNEAVEALLRIYREHPDTQLAKDADERLNMHYKYYVR